MPSTRKSMPPTNDKHKIGDMSPSNGKPSYYCYCNYYSRQATLHTPLGLMSSFAECSRPTLHQQIPLITPRGPPCLFAVTNIMK